MILNDYISVVLDLKKNKLWNTIDVELTVLGITKHYDYVSAWLTSVPLTPTVFCSRRSQAPMRAWHPGEFGALWECSPTHWRVFGSGIPTWVYLLRVHGTHHHIGFVEHPILTSAWHSVVNSLTWQFSFV